MSVYVGSSSKEGTCWPGINTIAAGLNLSRSTVKRASDDLVKAGLVKKSNRWRGNGSLKLYIKPEESTAYYVINEKYEGKIPC